MELQLSSYEKKPKKKKKTQHISSLDWMETSCRITVALDTFLLVRAILTHEQESVSIDTPGISSDLIDTEQKFIFFVI